MNCPKIVIVHLPKTGTTSIAHLFSDLLGKDAVQRVIVENHQFYNRNKEDLFWTDPGLFKAVWRKWMKDHFDELDKATVLWGHHPVNLWKEFFPDRLYITWMRNPVRRAISWFYWNQQLANWNSPKNIPDFLKDGIYNDAQALWMDFDINNFDFVGLTEFMSEDITWLWQTLGLGKPAVMPAINVQPYGYAHDVYSDVSLLSKIEQHNVLDMELYKSVIERR